LIVNNVSQYEPVFEKYPQKGKKISASIESNGKSGKILQLFLVPLNKIAWE